jgi:hypothetical protein
LVDYFFEEVQEMRVDIYDRDAETQDLSKHDFAGTASFRFVMVCADSPVDYSPATYVYTV